MNSDLLDSVNSTIHVGDKLIVTVPEPELSVLRTETKYYEEIYDEDTIYIENTDCFRTSRLFVSSPLRDSERLP
jgi:hypothetical protein